MSGQLALGIASIFAPLNSSMLAVALPSIRRDLSVGVGSVTILVSAYLIAVAVCQPAGGRIGDAFGHLRTIRVGIVVLILFSVASAFAWDFPSLVAMRSLQGISAALIMPNASAYLRKTVDVERLGGVLGMNGAVISAGAAFGPVVGGLLLAVGDWRWLFAINLPLGLLSLLLILRLPVDAGRGRSFLTLDTISLAALLAWFTGITLIGNSLRLGVPALTVLAFLLVAAGTVVYGARYRRSGTGVVDLKLFQRRNYAVAAAGTALTNVVMYTTLIAMPLYFREIEGLGDGLIGLSLLAMSAAMVIISPFSGQLSDRLGARPLLAAVGVCLVASPIGLAFAVGNAPLGVILGFLLLIGLGMGLISAPQSVMALQAIPREIAGMASGTYSMMRYVGSVAGAALIAGLLGSQASSGEFGLLFAVLAAVGAINLVAGSFARPVRPEAALAPLPPAAVRAAPEG